MVAASDLGLHCLPITLLGVFRLKRVKECLEHQCVCTPTVWYQTFLCTFGSQVERNDHCYRGQYRTKGHAMEAKVQVIGVFMSQNFTFYFCPCSFSKHFKSLPYLTFTTLWANLADNKLLFVLFSPENRF